MKISNANYPKYDNEYREVTVKSVNKDSFTDSEGWSFFVSEDSKVKPVVGMVARFYGKGIGFTVRGLFLDGQEVFYKTNVQQKLADEQRINEATNKRQKELDDNLDKRNEQYNALPEVFKRRIDKFRKTNPNFRRDYEPYEMFCCEQAIVFANHFKTIKSLEHWKGLDWEKQKELCPQLDNGHSGNTFGCSYGLAHAYLSNPELVVKIHGALTPLVGCEEYGCPH